jgi:hypothetical protein
LSPLQGFNDKHVSEKYISCKVNAHCSGGRSSLKLFDGSGGAFSSKSDLRVSSRVTLLRFAAVNGVPARMLKLLAGVVLLKFMAIVKRN